jgi:uncharacterized membrane protein HdeD (DUF308 family)
MRSDIVRNLVIILVGVMLVFMNESTMPLLVRIVGVLFFVPGFISLSSILLARRGAALLSVPVMVNVGSMALGLWLLFSPETFEGLFLKLLAVALFASSLYRLYYLYRRRRNSAVTWKMTLSPLLVAVASVVLFFNPFTMVSTLTLLLGLCAVFVGLSDIFLLLLLGNRRRGLMSRKER